MKDILREMPESGVRVSMAAETFTKIKQNKEKLGYEKGQRDLITILDGFARGHIKRQAIEFSLDEVTVDAFVRVLAKLEPVCPTKQS